MAITPADIQAKTFSEAKRGYDPGEVDVFLEQVSAEVDAMLNKIVDLKNRLTAAEQRLADTQNQLAAGFASQQIVEQRTARTTDMERAGRARRKSYSNFIITH